MRNNRLKTTTGSTNNLACNTSKEIPQKKPLASFLQFQAEMFRLLGKSSSRVGLGITTTNLNSDSQNMQSRALYSSIKTTSSSSSRRRTASFRVLFKRWINPNLHSLFANCQLKSGIHSVTVSLFYSNNCLAWDFRLTYAFCFVLNVCCLRDMIRGVTLNDPTCLSDTVNLRLTVLLVRRLKTT